MRSPHRHCTWFGSPGFPPTAPATAFSTQERRRFPYFLPCNAGQPAPQIVDGVSGGIEGALLYFVLLCLSDLGFRSPKVPANQVFGRSTLIPQQKIMLADQIPCELLLLHGPSGPVLRGGTQGRRRGRPPRPHQHALHLPGGRSAATTYLLHSSIFHVAVVKCSLPLSLSATTRHYDRCAVSGR